MNPFIRLLLSRLSRASRPLLQTQGLMRVKKIFNASALEWQPGNERVLVLAPHMDDETIGCGGTLARHVQAGAEVEVLFLTDGQLGGDPATRRGEAERALRELGIQTVSYGTAADGALRDDASAAALLRDVLRRLEPQIVYLPLYLEQHPDHRAASSVLAAAMAGLSASFLCHGYEVWTALVPNCLVRIDATVEAKRRAIGHYQSQLSEADYLHTALGLNAYRSSALLAPGCRYAEAFTALPVGEYLQSFAAFERACAP